jgi:hypothetical protein
LTKASNTQAHGQSFRIVRYIPGCSYCQVEACCLPFSKEILKNNGRLNLNLSTPKNDTLADQELKGASDFLLDLESRIWERGLQKADLLDPWRRIAHAADGIMALQASDSNSLGLSELSLTDALTFSYRDAGMMLYGELCANGCFVCYEQSEVVQRYQKSSR